MNRPTTDLQSVLLAGLLHDIGKFRQRALREQLRGQTHQQIGRDWLQQMGYPDILAMAESTNSLVATKHTARL